MPAWKHRFKQAATDWLNLPPDAVDDISRVTVLGGREVIVEHIAALLRVDSDLIEIDLGKQGLRIIGTAFEVNLASKAEVHLTGDIKQVLYVNREDLQ